MDVKTSVEYHLLEGSQFTEKNREPFGTECWRRFESSDMTVISRQREEFKR